MNKKYIKLIGTAGIITIALAGGGIVGLPIIEQANVKAAEKQAIVENNAGLQAQLDSLSIIEAKSSEIDKMNTELSSKFPNIPKGTNIIDSVTAAANEAGLTASAVTSITFETPQKITADGSAVAENEAAAATPAAEETPAATTAASEAPAPSGGPVEAQTSTTDSNGNAVISGTLDAPLPGSAAQPVAPGAQAVIPGTSSDPAASANPLASMGISVSVKGTEDQVVNFAKNFYSMNRTVKVSAISLNGSEVNDAELSVTGKTYLYISVLAPVKQ